jgi:hypothetical protein
MKKLLLIAIASFAVVSCRQSGTSGDAVDHVSETGTKTSEEGSSGGERINPEATSAAVGDSATQNATSNNEANKAPGTTKPGE